MAWLRLDDNFTSHPKFAGWTASQKWAWLEVLSYCAKLRTNGRVPDDLSLLPRSCTPSLIKLAQRSALIDEDKDGKRWVHDWLKYNLVHASDDVLVARVSELLSEHPEASANEIVKMLGGNRKRVLAAIHALRGGSGTGSEGGSGTGTGTGSESGSGSVPDRFQKVVTRARSRPLGDSTTVSEGRDLPEPSASGADVAAKRGPPPAPSGDPTIDAKRARKLAGLAQFVHDYWDDYPDKDVLLDELTDSPRSLSIIEATQMIAAEKGRRAKVAAEEEIDW